ERARPSPNWLSRFVGQHFALVVVGILAAIFGPMALIGPTPPLRPQAVTKLSSEDRKFIADLRSAPTPHLDAGPPGPDYADFRDLPNMTKLAMVKKFWSYSENTDAGTTEPH